MSKIDQSYLSINEVPSLQYLKSSIIYGQGPIALLNLQVCLDEATMHWGVKVERVEM